MASGTRGQSWFWTTLILSSITIAGAVFAFWELIENRFFRDIDYVSLHYLYISRGITSSLFLAVWAAWFVMRQRRRSEEELRRSRERYLGLLDASPSGVALIDGDLIICEWNAAAERMYGFSKEEARGRALPTIPLERQQELMEFIRSIDHGERVLDRESQRQTKSGKLVNVQFSLLPYRENGNAYYLEITTDIDERVRLRERLIEFEKLTAMGKMAAGTAHHLNTPLTSMLLRVQMMSDRVHNNSCSYDLEHLEKSLHFCRDFVRRLLEFSRRPAAEKHPENIGSIIESVAGFLSPSLTAKAVELDIRFAERLSNVHVLADRNQLETVLLILLSNALEVSSQQGTIGLRVDECLPSGIQLTIEDEGCGISPDVSSHLFEPFFTTKPSGKGTGLGLALAKSILIEHGGTVDLKARSGRGAVATVNLPVFKPGSDLKGRLA